jgi:hypothetical protein
MIPTIIHNIRTSKFTFALLGFSLHSISSIPELKDKLPKCPFNKPNDSSHLKTNFKC